MNKVRVIGGGIAGCNAAIFLSKEFDQVELYEKNDDILNGPPFCHLHAGGFLYPMITLDECVKLLQDSLWFAKFYRECLIERPTIIAYNKNSNYDPQELIYRAHYLNKVYNTTDKILGCNYLKIYTKDDMILMKKNEYIEKDSYHDKYMNTFAQILNDVDSIKYPVVSVKEWGICLDSVKAKIKRTLGLRKNIKLYTNTEYKQGHDDECTIINATGYEMNDNSNGYLEMKSSWMVYHVNNLKWFPEIAIIGERGTENGLLQITPHKQHTYQIHYMSYESTLFGRIKIGETFNNKWFKNKRIDDRIIYNRTQKSIDRMTYFFKIFKTATVSVLDPLWGIQRIVGNDYDKRTYSIDKINNLYQLNIVKGISAVNACWDLSRLVKKN